MGKEPFSEMEKKVALSLLLDFYGDMLTDTQREMARLHWEEDLSFSEIAQQFSISRQSVHDTVSRTEKQLEGLEEKLRLFDRFEKTERGLGEALQALSRVQPTPETAEHLQAARRIMIALQEQEDM